MNYKLFVLLACTITVLGMSSACEPVNPVSTPETTASESESSIPPSSSGIQWGANKPETNLRTVSSLPDDAGLSMGQDDSREGSKYHIAALNLDIDIPEGYYLYHIKGEYKDADGNPVTLEFVDEYIFTMMEKSTEELITDLRTYDEGAHSPGYKGPGYVLYSFKVMPSVYLPVESFYVSDLPLNKEYRVCGDYLCMTGRCEWRLVRNAGANNKSRWVCYHDRDSITSVFKEGIEIPADNFPVQIWENAILNATSGNGLPYSHTGAPLPDDPPAFMANLWPMFRNYSAERILPAYITSQEAILNADTSVLNDMWWHQYQTALSELSQAPSEDQEVYVTGDWHEDRASDSKLRAWLCANRSLYESIAPDDLMILFKETDALRLYRVFISQKLDETANKAESSSISTFTEVEKGVDYLALCDLDYARAYALKHLSLD